jgi:hypothetical protein
MNRQIIFGIFLVFGVVVMLGFVRSEMLTSSANVSYDSYILEQFNNSNSSWVNIFFRLNNYSEADNIISNFSVNETNHILKHDLSESISLDITQEGFNKLINDSRVSAVYYNSPVEGISRSPSSCGNGICNSGDNCLGNSCLSNAEVNYGTDILNYFQNQSEVSVLIELNDNSGLPATSVNERDAWFRSQIDEVLNNLSNKEFQLDSKFSESFGGYISQEGFNELINDSRIKSIIFSPSGGVAYGGSSSLSCGYKACDNLTYQRYKNILKEFNNTNWVPVIVEMFSVEKTDNLISSFSDTDFKNVEKELSPSIFIVEVTKTGLDELFNNSEIKTINLEESSSLAGNNLTESKFNWLWITLPIVILLIIILGIFFIKKKKKINVK